LHAGGAARAAPGKRAVVDDKVQARLRVCNNEGKKFKKFKTYTLVQLVAAPGSIKVQARPKVCNNDGKKLKEFKTCTLVVQLAQLQGRGLSWTTRFKLVLGFATTKEKNSKNSKLTRWCSLSQLQAPSKCKLALRFATTTEKNKKNSKLARW
jgi:hypothetical protein